LNGFSQQTLNSAELPKSQPQQGPTFGHTLQAMAKQTEFQFCGFSIARLRLDPYICNKMVSFFEKYKPSSK
jgi:hypothetical protein